MKDAYEVLYQKEADLVRVRQEVESLRIVASLLNDDASADDPGQSSDGQSETAPPEAVLASHLEAAATGTDGPVPISHEPGFWKSLKSRRR
jgi:hypothetical protein